VVPERGPFRVDDAELLQRCLAGETAAWGRLVRTHAAVMHAVVARLLQRGRGPQLDIEDVLQGVFLKLWEDDRRRLRSFRGGCRLSTWLAAVARREALDRLRQRARRERHTATYEERRRDEKVAPAGPHALAADREAGLRVDDALQAIPPRDRLLVTLVGEDGWTYRNVARVLGVRENSIGPLLKRARERLASALAGQGT